MKTAPDVNDTLQKEGSDAVRARHDAAQKFINGKDQTERMLKSSGDFVKGFVPPDYLIDGLLQRRFFYSLTGKTGGGKTAIALLFAAHVALGKPIGKYEVTQGRVLYLAGENPDDVRMRWIAMAQQMDFDINAIDVCFVEGKFNIPDQRARIVDELKDIGELAFVIVDTSATFFDGDDENSNPQLLAHAQMLRTLVKLPGQPCILANCHPVKNATPDNLIPRGGGSFLAETDGNLTSAKDDLTVEVHWQGKFRGPDFAPLAFLLKSVTHQDLKDSKGRLIPTVIATHLTEAGQEEIAKVARSNEDRLLAEIDRDGKASWAEYAKQLGWFLKNGEPHKTQVRRTLDKLKNFKLVAIERDRTVLTEKGKKALKKDTAGDNVVTTPKIRVLGPCDDDAVCLHCRKSGDVKRISNLNNPGGKTETLHEECAVQWFMK
jgi:hypothetical protein